MRGCWSDLMPQTLGTFIRERRQDMGLTQEELAERVGDGVRQAEISRLEHNQISMPRRTRLEQLAAALDVSLGELLIRTGWLNEDQRADVPENGQGISRGNLSTIDGSAVDQIDIALAQVAAARALVENVAVVLETAERSLTTAINALEGGGIRPRIGVIDRWETDAVFIA
jgi:transcriptional regulator with XRE-family HTH domain